MKFPVFSTFIPLVLISIVISAVTVLIFAQMHDNAVNNAMERSIKDSLTFVKEKVSAPMTKLQAEALILKQQIITKDIFSYQPARKSFNGTWDYPTSFDDPAIRSFINDMLIHLNMAGGLYSYVYQSFRNPKPRSSASPTSTDPADYPWADTICAMVGTCAWAVDPTYAPVMSFKWPHDINFTIVDNAPYDSTGYAYNNGQRALKNTTEDADGQWVAHEIWKDIYTKKLGAILTFAVPIAFDANGDVVNTVGMDMDMSWTATFLKNLNITVSEVSIIFPKSMDVLATSYKSLEPGFKKKDESDPESSFVFWRADESPEPLLTTAISTLKSHLGDVSFQDMSDEAHLTSNDDYIFSVQPIRESKLDLMVVIVTEKGYYFDEGHRARNEAIVISVVLLAVMVACTILNAIFLTSPLKVLGVRMIKTAALQDDDDDCETSYLSEISDMQEAYYTMRSELGRLKSYLPQSVLHGNEDDDDDDEGSIPDSSLSGKPSTKRSNSRSTNGKSHIGDSVTNASSNKTTDSAKMLVGLNTDSSINTKTIVVMSINLINFHGLVKSRGAAFCDMQRQYLELVNKCVRESKGYVDFFQGDHVVATFNAVNNIAAPSKRAAMAAHNIAKALREHDNLQRSVAIGFSNGTAHVGNMGTKEMQRFNVVGSVYARALALQQLATKNLKESVENQSAENAAHQPSPALRKSSSLAHNPISRVFTTKDTTLEFDCDIYWQACDLVRNLPGRIDSSKPSVVVAVEHLKNAKCDEWMYQLEESESSDPFSNVNAAFALLAEKKTDEARKVAENVRDQLLGAAKLKMLLEAAEQ